MSKKILPSFSRHIAATFRPGLLLRTFIIASLLLIESACSLPSNRMVLSGELKGRLFAINLILFSGVDLPFHIGGGSSQNLLGTPNEKKVVYGQFLSKDLSGFDFSGDFAEPPPRPPPQP